MHIVFFWTWGWRILYLFDIVCCCTPSTHVVLMLYSEYSCCTHVVLMLYSCCTSDHLLKVSYLQLTLVIASYVTAHYTNDKWNDNSGDGDRAVWAEEPDDQRSAAVEHQLYIELRRANAAQPRQPQYNGLTAFSQSWRLLPIRTLPKFPLDFFSKVE